MKAYLSSKFLQDCQEFDIESKNSISSALIMSFTKDFDMESVMVNIL